MTCVEHNTSVSFDFQILVRSELDYVYGIFMVFAERHPQKPLTYIVKVF